jgi:predicted RND superfamily exporter protein
MGPAYLTEVTGLYAFYAKLVAGLWRDQFRSLGLTIPAVLVVLILVLRSVPVGLVAMVPTSLPVVFCLGGMGWTGIPIDMTTAMMLSVTIGIAVDDAVHYLWRFRATLAESGDYFSALKAAHGSVGRACVFTTVVITGGFWILTMSRFLPTAYFGGLLGFTMCGALAGNLMLLPAMVMTLRPFRSSTP